MVDPRWFALATVGNYVLLTVLWAIILVMYLRYRRLARRDDPLVALLAGVLALDAFKSLVENAFFGVVWAGRYGIGLEALAHLLSLPSVLVMPKLLNLAVTLVILGVVIARYIPEQIAAQRARRIEEARLRTELEASLARVRDEERRWQLAVEANASGIWDVDLDQRRAWVSPRLARQVGLSPEALAEQVVSDGWLERIHPDDRPRFLELRREFLSGRAPTFSAEFRFREAGGSWRRIVSRGAAFRAPDGRATRVVGSHEDVTEQRLAEEALAARTRMESLGILAGGIAHDFNNLLAIIRGNAWLARTIGGARADEALADLDAAVTRASELTSRLLAYSGRGRFVVAPLDLSERGRELVRMLASSFPANVKVETSFPDELPLVEADAAQLQQVLLNLVGNAVEAIGTRPGSVRIAAEARTATTDVPSSLPGATPAPPGEYVVLSVEDDGVGMTPEVQARIFEPFWSSKGSGRGLGLSAMLGILQAHGAALQLESAPDRGTRFAVWFPASTATRPPTPRPVEPRNSIPPGTRRRVLVADDEELLLKLVSTFLVSAGYTADTARSGDEALERIARRGAEYCLVVLDITMPPPDGRAVLAEIRKRFPELPVILTSGYAQEAAPLDAYTRFLQKPFSAGSLREVIEEACPIGG